MAETGTRNTEHGTGPSPSLVTRHSSLCTAFTLIEMLIVIAIISILAALIFPVMDAVNKAKIINLTKGELANIETAIESYKAKYGVYPPDSYCPSSTPANPIYINQLYYELLGTTFTPANVNYTTLDGSSTLTNATPANLLPVFGTNVGGFVNSTKGGGDEGSSAVAFMKGLKPSQNGIVGSGVHILVCSVPWPKDNLYQPTGIANSGLNPWRYVSSNPTNNANSFDLWVDVMIGHKTNRVSNWSAKPQEVGAP